MRPHRVTIAAILLAEGLGTSLAAEQPAQICFYLDKGKLHEEIAPLMLQGASSSFRLDTRGLFRNNELVCRWSLNGGSGTKERFSLDGDVAIPILNPACEAPFSHEVTGVGFGDWYITLCGSASGSSVSVEADGARFLVPLSSLREWTQFQPGEFPIKGDVGD